MATIRLFLDTRAKRKDGTYPLKLAVHHRKPFNISIGVHLLDEQWIDGKVYMPDNKSEENALNAYIKVRLSDAKNALRRLTLLNELKTMTDKQLRAALDTKIQDEPEEEHPILFKDHYNSYIKNLTARNTIGTYNDMFTKLSKFADVDTLTFEQMNYAWLKDFEIFMRNDGLATNSRGIYFRNIRTLFNDAIDRDIIPLSLYPFRRFKIAREKTQKRSLSIEQLQLLRDYPCEKSQKQYRDIFMLIFYLCGINLIDLCNLKEIDNGYIYYQRAKTKRPYKIKVEPEALAIIEKYKGNDYLLDILDRYQDHKNYMHRLNKNLKEIGHTEIVNRKNGRPGKKEKTGIFPTLSSYWARHTWASIAAGLDIPKETIAAALGHSNNSVTDIYIDFDQKKIDKANREVLDALNQKTAP